jgi:hypothetical protein
VNRVCVSFVVQFLATQCQEQMFLVQRIYLFKLVFSFSGPLYRSFYSRYTFSNLGSLVVGKMKNSA